MSIDSLDFDYIRYLVRDRAGILLAADQVSQAELRLEPIAQLAGVDSVGELVALLKIQPFNRLHAQVVEALLLNETSFFRDIYPFEALQKFLLPRLLKKRLGDRTLNIWCAACSSGQEPYSIALMLHQHFPIFSKWKVQFVASDISNEVLARANEGIYSQEEVDRGLTPTLVKRYFQPLGDRWQLKKDIRQMVEFRQINLAELWPQMPSMDIIFMRNVLIYFDIKIRKSILEQVGQLLSPDGYLFLGVSETTITLDDSFEPVQFDKTVCYRLRGDR